MSEAEKAHWTLKTDKYFANLKKRHMGTHIDEAIRKKIEEALVKRISKDSPGAYYTFIDERIITMRQARDVAEEIYQLAQDHFKKFTLLKSEPTVTSDGTTPIESNQDELWEDAIELYAENSEKAKKRYRITRAK